VKKTPKPAKSTTRGSKQPRVASKPRRPKPVRQTTRQRGALGATSAY
jgi:hypothetical protein